MGAWWGVGGRPRSVGTSGTEAERVEAEHVVCANSPTAALLAYQCFDAQKAYKTRHHQTGRTEAPHAIAQKCPRVPLPLCIRTLTQALLTAPLHTGTYGIPVCIVLLPNRVTANKRADGVIQGHEGSFDNKRAAAP